MKEDLTSATAQHVAMQRAAHQLFDEPRVLDDPLSLAIVGKEAAAILAAVISFLRF